MNARIVCIAACSRPALVSGVVVGADLGERLYGEARFGMDEMPDVRLLAGFRLLMK